MALRPAVTPQSVRAAQAVVTEQRRVANLATSLAIEDADATKEPTIAPGAANQYWRGDKTFQNLDKDAVGLPNVDNTADTDKPVSNATQTEIDALQSQIDGLSGIILFRFAQTFGNATDVSYSITHNKGTADVIVQVNNLTGSVAVPDLTITGANTLSVSFDVAPGVDAFRVVVI